MGRRFDSDDQPSYRADTGRRAFRFCWEEPDERPVVRFADCGCDGCREFYIRHARAREPKPVQPEEKPMVGELRRAVQRMAPAHMTRRERDERLAELREQEQEITQ